MTRPTLRADAPQVGDIARQDHVAVTYKERQMGIYDVVGTGRGAKLTGQPGDPTVEADFTAYLAGALRAEPCGDPRRARPGRRIPRT